MDKEALYDKLGTLKIEAIGSARSRALQAVSTQTDEVDRKYHFERAHYHEGEAEGLRQAQELLDELDA
jgi:hypothetical protein